MLEFRRLKTFYRPRNPSSMGFKYWVVFLPNGSVHSACKCSEPDEDDNWAPSILRIGMDTYSSNTLGLLLYALPIHEITWFSIWLLPSFDLFSRNSTSWVSLGGIGSSRGRLIWPWLIVCVVRLIQIAAGVKNRTIFKGSSVEHLNKFNKVSSRD